MSDATQPTDGFNAAQSYDQTIEDIFAESYWEKYETDLANHASQSKLQADEVAALEIGNKRTQGNQTLNSDSNYSNLPSYAAKNSDTASPQSYGHSGLTQEQAMAAAQRYKIIAYQTDDNTGFSGILIQDTNTGNYILEFRSTEYAEDFDKDALGADQNIKNSGFALAQLNSANNWYQSLMNGNPPILPSGSSVILGGYSLGGALASSVYAMYPNNFTKLQLENSPGIGAFNGNVSPTATQAQTDITNMVNDYNNYITSPSVFLNTIFHNFLITYTQTDLINVLAYINQHPNYNTSSTVPSNMQTLLDAITPEYNALTESNNTTKVLITDIYNGVSVAISLENQNENLNSSNITNVYQNNFYQLVQKYVQNIYKTTRNDSSIINNVTQEFREGSTGIVDTNVFNPSNVSDFKGVATYDYYHKLKTDHSFVADSNIHAQSNSVFIEAQPSFEGLIGQTPFLPSLTSHLIGAGNDFANNHSITLIEDSLKSMAVIQAFAPGLTLQEGNDLLSSINNEFATYHASTGEQDTTETHTISKLILSLARLFDSTEQNIEQFVQKILSVGTTDETFSNKTYRSAIQTEEDNITNNIATNNNLTIESIYTSQDNTPANQSVLSVDDIVSKAMSDTPEGLAYRYALRELDPYALVGYNYSSQNTDGSLDIGAHSVTWYTQRARILDEIIAENVNNSGLYFDQGQVIISNYNASEAIPYNFVTTQQYTKDESKLLLGNSSSEINNVINYSTISGGTKGNTIFGTTQLNTYSGSNQDDYIFVGGSSSNIVTLNTQNINQGFLNSTKNIFNTNLNYSGDDYIETTSGSTTNINCGVGNDTFCLYGTTTVNNYSGLGSISLDGHILTNAISIDSTTYHDASYSNITYQFGDNLNGLYGLSITNSDTGDSVFFTNLNTTIKNYLGLTFNNQDSTIISNTDNNLNAATMSNIFTQNAVVSSVGLVNGATYTSIPDETVQFNQTIANTTFYKNGNDLYLYDDINGTSLKLTDFYGQVTVGLQNSDGSIQSITRNAYDGVNFIGGNGNLSGLNSVSLAQSLGNPQTVNLLNLFNQIQSGNAVSSIINLRDYDTLLIPENLEFLNIGLKKVNNDLELYSLTNSNAIPAIIKNYFNLNQNETHIYYTNSNGNQLNELSQSDLSKYFILTSNNGSNIDLSQGSSNGFSSAEALSGNNNISGGVQNNYLMSGNFNFNIDGIGLQNPINNVMNGGSGANIFEISNNATNNVINNFKKGDQILVEVDYSLGGDILSNHNINTQKDGNDLIITGGSGINEFVTRVSDYFSSMSLTDAMSHSGIFISDLYGNQEISLSNLWNDATHALYSIKTSNQTLDESQNSNIQTIVSGLGDDTIIGNNNGNTIDGGGGNDVITGGTGENSYYFDPADNQIGNTTITDFKGNSDKLNVGVSGLGNVSAIKNGEDLTLNFYNDQDSTNPVSTIKLQGYYNLADTNLNDNTNISLIDMLGNTTILTNNDLNNYLSNNIYNTSTLINGVNTINANNSIKNTTINTQTPDTTIIGSTHNDTVSGLGNDIFYLTSGQDTYSFNSSDGVDVFKYDPTYNRENSNGNSVISELMDGINHTTIQLDSSISTDDIGFYYDQTDSLLTIMTGLNNGIKIENVDENSLDNLNTLISLKDMNGNDLLSSTNPNYQVLFGEPLGGLTSNTNSHYNLSNNIYYGDDSGNTIVTTQSNSIVDDGYGNDTIEATDGNNLLFGGSGNDTIYTNSYLFNENSTSQASMVIGGEDSDNLYLGNHDLAIFAPGDGSDTVNYNSANDNFTLSFMQGADDVNNQSNFALFVGTNGNDLTLGYNQDNQDDSVTLTNFWNLSHDDIQIALTEESQQGNGEHVVRSYNLDDILSQLGVTQVSGTNNITTVNYSDIQPVMQNQDYTNILGGVVAQNYLINSTIEGISQSSTQNVLSHMDNPYLSSVDNNPNGIKV